MVFVFAPLLGLELKLFVLCAGQAGRPVDVFGLF